MAAYSAAFHCIASLELEFYLTGFGALLLIPQYYTAFTPSKSRYRVHFVILMMTKD